MGTVEWTREMTTFDAALVRVPRGFRGVNCAPQIGAYGAVVSLSDMKLGTRVCKYGAWSGFTVGVLTSVQKLGADPESGDVSDPLSLSEIEPLFDEEYRYTSFCSRGDSGSVVAMRVDRSTDVPVLGLLVAQATVLERGYIVSLDGLFRHLKVSLA